MATVSNSRVLCVISLLIAVCLVSFPAQAQYGGGMGEPNDPYLIYTAEQMNAIGANQGHWDKDFKLMADIDLSSYTGTDFNIIGSWSSPFRGVFDGNGHTISNFNYTSTGAEDIGLFAYVGPLFWIFPPVSAGEIKDLGLIDPNIEVEAGNHVGSLVGQLKNGTITGCYCEGVSVSGIWRVGGLVGYNHYGSITTSYSTGTVIGGDYVGGLVGYNYGDFEDYGRITTSYSAGSVSGNDYVGGLVGENSGSIDASNSAGRVEGNGTVGGLVGSNKNKWLEGSGSITMSYSTGTVRGNGYVGGLVGDNHWDSIITTSYSTAAVTGSGYFVGGLVGNNYGGITTSYSTSTVSGDNSVGGLVGWNEVMGFVDGCYSSGSVSGNRAVGGLVGEIGGMCPITNSFWDIETSGQAESAGGEGKTTAEMQMKSTFTDAGWDFVGESINGLEDTWRILEGQDYPRLTWELLLDASAEDFVDVWLNDDPNTSGITRLIIVHKISDSGSEMIVHGYGKAHPYDIDWGTIPVPYTGNPFVAVYEHGFKTNTLTIQLVNFDSLNVHSSNVFHDGTNRDYEADYFMHRAVGPEEIVINIDEDFEYVPQGWPLGLAPSQTPAVGLSSGPYEALIKEPEYGSGQVLYGYIPLGNSNDVKISLAVDTSDINNWLLYVDTNNNEDLTDDGLPYRNEGTGKLASLISLHVEVVSASGETIARPYKLWIWFRESASPLFYARCHYRSQISIGEEQYTAIVYEIINHDALYRDSGLWIDLNRDGKLGWDKSEEHFQDGAVISIEGKEYVLSLNYP